jgi:hypothetical protein
MAEEACGSALKPILRKQISIACMTYQYQAISIKPHRIQPSYSGPEAGWHNIGHKLSTSAEAALIPPLPLPVTVAHFASAKDFPPPPIV